MINVGDRVTAGGIFHRVGEVIRLRRKYGQDMADVLWPGQQYTIMYNVSQLTKVRIE